MGEGIEVMGELWCTICWKNVWYRCDYFTPTSILLCNKC